MWKNYTILYFFKCDAKSMKWLVMNASIPSKSAHAKFGVSDANVVIKLSEKDMYMLILQLPTISPRVIVVGAQHKCVQIW